MIKVNFARYKTTSPKCGCGCRKDVRVIPVSVQPRDKKRTLGTVIAQMKNEAQVINLVKCIPEERS